VDTNTLQKKLIIFCHKFSDMSENFSDGSILSCLGHQEKKKLYANGLNIKKLCSLKLGMTEKKIFYRGILTRHKIFCRANLERHKIFSVMPIIKTSENFKKLLKNNIFFNFFWVFFSIKKFINLNYLSIKFFFINSFSPFLFLLHIFSSSMYVKPDQVDTPNCSTPNTYQLLSFSHFVLSHFHDHLQHTQQHCPEKIPTNQTNQ
jgi:hypothetical protein